MTTQTFPISSSRLVRATGPLLTIGGLLWIFTFLLIIVHGMRTGNLPNLPDPQSPLYLRIGIRLYVLSIPILNLGLIGVFLQVQRRARMLAMIAVAFTALAVLLGIANLIMLSGLVGEPTFSDTFGGLAVMTTSLSTAFLGIAALRGHSLTRSVAATLLFIGVTTIPILFTTPWPVGPAWATDFLAFLVSGTAYVVVGVRSNK